MTTPAKLVVEDGPIRIYHGKAETWAGPEPIDLVFTNPYGPLPTSLRHHPMIVHQWTHRIGELAAWCGCHVDDLQLLGAWNDGREAFYCLNTPTLPIDLSAYRPEPGGWYPEQMADEILATYNMHRLQREAFGNPKTVWDGFMGRGTIGKVARERGWNYVGVEELGRHIAIAVEYLGVL